jgi:prepilin-type N-terminal cleavage/methylation domain-containing protein
LNGPYDYIKIGKQQEGEMRVKMKHRGYTLVEILIVIIIVAMLTSAMLLSQRASEASAQATAIINDLRLMKSSAYLFFQESGDLAPAPGVNYAELLGKYMEHGRIVNDPVRYAFFVIGDIWWVGVKVEGYESDRVNGILEGKARDALTLPLYGSNNILTPPPTRNPIYVYKNMHSAVWTNAR